MLRAGSVNLSEARQIRKKTHDMFDHNLKFPNSNQLSIVFPDTFIYCPGDYIGEMSGYALSEEKPRS